MSESRSSRRVAAEVPSEGRGRVSRISVGLSEGTLNELQQLAAQEGRSLSNLCARLIEGALRSGIHMD